MSTSDERVICHLSSKNHLVEKIRLQIDSSKDNESLMEVADGNTRF